MGSSGPARRSGATVGSTAGSPVFGRAPAVLARVGSALAAAAVTVVVVVGAVRVPVTVLVSAALVSLFLLALPAVVPPETARHPGTRRRSRLVLLTTAAFAPFTAGAHVAGLPPHLLALTVMGLASVVLLRWVRSWTGETQEPAPATSPAAPQTTPEGLEELLAVLPLENLFVEWQSVRAASENATAADRDRLVDALSLLIAEFNRRNPQAAQRWLGENPSAPPDRWFDGEPHDRAA